MQVQIDLVDQHDRLRPRPTGSAQSRELAWASRRVRSSTSAKVPRSPSESCRTGIPVLRPSVDQQSVDCLSVAGNGRRLRVSWAGNAPDRVGEGRQRATRKQCRSFRSDYLHAASMRPNSPRRSSRSRERISKGSSESHQLPGFSPAADRTARRGSSRTVPPKRHVPRGLSLDVARLMARSPRTFGSGPACRKPVREASRPSAPGGRSTYVAVWRIR